jgi:hypothetical protein
MKHWKYVPLEVWTALACLFAIGPIAKASETNVENQLHLLQQQNDSLQHQLRQQQEMIDSLSREVAGIRQGNQKRSVEVAAEKPANESEGTLPLSGFSLGKVQITGEGGIGFFESGSEGAFPNSEFRVDEAKIFIEAPVWANVYAFSEINLASQNASDVNLQLGEMYLDVEDVSQLWGRERQLNLRLGRLDIPFGEEYLVRDSIDNPLISHSLADFWGVDEGIEVYGTLGKFAYVLAVQNGGISTTRDYAGDKSIAGRVSFDPKPWLHLSASGMRTGDLDVEQDSLSEMWFGNGWFRSLGSPATTTFQADVFQGDVALQFRRGHLKAFGGYIRYDDNDPAADNGRDVYYYSVEGLCEVTREFYTVARFGQVFARDGFPVVGNGDMGKYLFGPLVEEMWRLSLGIGYRWNRHFVIKAEYTWERGKQVGGGIRKHEDLFATEAAFAF